MKLRRHTATGCLCVVAVVIITIRQFYALTVTSSLISSTFPDDVTLELENKKKISKTNKNKNKKNYDSSDQFPTLSTLLPITTPTSGTNNIPIRKWGCNITLSPFIFIHIGKAGGGSVRARIAASAINYTRGNLWKHSNIDSHYYPIPKQRNNVSDLSYHEGKFCTSRYPHFRPIEHEDFEGVSVCHAITPIGQMIGCPMRKAKSQECFCSHKRNRCDLIYVGHNFIGSELHWLPGPYLKDWWNSNTTMRPYKNSSNSSNSANNGRNDSSIEIEKYLRELSTSRLLTYNMRQNRNEKNISSCYLPVKRRSNITKYNTKFIPGGTNTFQYVRSIPFGFFPDEEFHAQCLNRFVKEGDQLGRNWYQTNNIDGSTTVDDKKQQAPMPREEEDWSTLYASLPVARVTVLRDPFSWLLSKFFWHRLYFEYNTRCDDIEFGTIGSVVNQNRDNKYYKNNDLYAKSSPTDDAATSTTLLQNHDQLSVLKWNSNDLDRGKGWMVKYALGYMLYICGEDCVSRLHYGKMSLEAIYKQAKHNLYTSFAVVGILNETNTFYDMVSARMSYMDMKLNPHVHGKPHKSPTMTYEGRRCKEQFLKNTTFQLELLRNSPEVQFLYNLYHDAIRVNRFQQQDLKDTCNVNFDNDKNNATGDVRSTPTRRNIYNKTQTVPNITVKTIKRRKRPVKYKQGKIHKGEKSKGTQKKEKRKKVVILSRVNKKVALIS